ncbi:unnamed protein product [Ectocarpus sp. CCAP 1310/34]|nr:unnamed protein product [Ectocarpus sp. CCAP 1310/34]
MAAGSTKGSILRRPDVLPAYLYGPGHNSLTYGLELDDASGTPCRYQDQILKNEINRANSTEVRQKFAEATSDTVRQWLNEKGAAHAAAAYRCKFNAKKRLYREQELVVSRDSSIEEQLGGPGEKGAFNAYAARTQYKGKRKFQARWKALFALRTLMESKGDRPLGAPPIRLAGGDSALYEQMFRAEPRKHVSRPTFLTVMRRVYGFQTAPLAGHVDKAALQKLGEVYSTFDADGVGKVDWRCMVFMLRVTVNAQSTVEENLKWGFALYSSPGSFDPESDDPVSMSDFKNLVNTMARFEKREELNRILDEAWEAVASEDNEAGRRAGAGRGVGEGAKAPKPLEITMRLLGLMLQKRPLKDLLRPASRFGLRDRGTWTYAIEEAFFDPLLLALIMQKRRDQRNDGVTAIFLGNKRRRAILVRIAMWKRLVRRRKHCARLMASIGGRFFKGNSSSAFRAIQRRAIACKACETIQRVYRGYLARLVAGFLRVLVRRVIAAQEYFDREMAVIDAEVERVEYRSRQKAASKLQRLWRARRERRRREAEKLRMIKIHEVEAEMQQLLSREAREAEVYKRELMAWFKEQKKEQEQSTMLEEHTAKEKFKAAAERFEEQRVEQWQIEWAEKGETRAIAHRKMLEAVLAHPDNEPEKALQKTLKAEIEAQKKVVLKMADDAEADLEAPEALDIAKEDILLSKMDQERERVNQEMKAAAAKFLAEEARVKADKEEKMTKFRGSACDAAARTIQQMYYVFSATRITQKRAKEVYTKHFDSENLAFYWHNTLIDTYLWKKPTGLGGWDVDPEDRECDLQFSTRWCNRDSKPFCDTCYDARHFSKENPSTGPNPVTPTISKVNILAKAADFKPSTTIGRRQALSTKHILLDSARTNVQPLSYKTLDGAVPGSKELVDLDYISEQPDIAVETWEQQPSSLAIEGHPVVPIPEAPKASALDDAGAAGGDGGSQYAVQQHATGASDIVGFGRSDDEPSGVLQPAGVRDEADGGTGESEMEEYLDSQQTFTYDNPSEGISNAEQIVDVGGNDNSFNTPNGALAEGSDNNTRGVVDGSSDVAWEKKKGAEASASGVGAASIAPETWGWATPGSAWSDDGGRVESASSGEFHDGVTDCPATGPLPAGLQEKDTTNNVSVGPEEGEAASIAGIEGLMKAEASEYDPSTPSYGLDK